jgi:general secretion pathway protein A
MYEEFFGLSGKPFQLNPDPGFFFASKGHKRALAYLDYGLHQGEGFIVITGEVGAGKTTLLRGMIDRLPQDSIVATQIVSTQVEADDLLRLVAEGFGLPTEGVDKSALLTDLRQFCLREHERGKRALLIVDEAQNLPPRAVEELRMLSNFQLGTRSLVQSFLVGQPELRDMMQAPEMSQLKQRIIASYHLGPLDAEETRSYVQHRLRHVGWSEDPAFEAAAFEDIHQRTGGIPRRINGLCDRLMLACYLAEVHVVSAEMVREVADDMSRELEPPVAARASGSHGNGRTETAATLAKPGAREPSRAIEQARQTAPSRREVYPAGDEATEDWMEDAEGRIAALESSLHVLQMRLKRVSRQVERLSGDLELDA